MYICALEGSFNINSLIGYKSVGGLKCPSQSVVTICTITEKQLKIQSCITNIINTKYKLIVINNVLTNLININLFDKDSNHIFDENHYALIIKCVIEKYLKVRYHFMAKN